MKVSAVMLLFAAGWSCVLLHAEAAVCRSAFFPRGKHSASYYTFDYVMRNWAQARDHCRSQGGHLVSIETAEENEYLKRVIKTHYQNQPIKGIVARHWWFGFWTSGNDVAREGRFVWTATGTPVTLWNWGPGQPDNLGNEDYLQIHASNGLWNDVPANFRMYSICEF